MYCIQHYHSYHSQISANFLFTLSQLFFHSSTVRYSTVPSYFKLFFYNSYDNIKILKHFFFSSLTQFLPSTFIFSYAFHFLTLFTTAGVNTCKKVNKMLYCTYLTTELYCMCIPHWSYFGEMASHTISGWIYSMKHLNSPTMTSFYWLIIKPYFLLWKRELECSQNYCTSR